MTEVSRKSILLGTGRTWDTYSEPNKLHDLIQEHTLDKDCMAYLPDGLSPTIFKGMQGIGIFAFEIIKSDVSSYNKSLTMFKTSGIYFIESTYEVMDFKNRIAFCKPKQIRLTTTMRKQDRKNIRDGFVSVNNLLVSKPQSSFKGGAGVVLEVILADAAKSIKEKYPKVELTSFYNKEGLASEDEEILQKHKVPIFITDTRKMESSKEIKCFDYKKYLEDDFTLDDKKADLLKENVFSFIYYPIFYSIGNESTLIAYLYYATTTKILIEMINYFKEMETLIIKRVTDSSTITINDRQSVLNVSDTGMLLEVKTKMLMESLLFKQTFNADINFKGQTPVRMTLCARHAKQIDENTMHVGVEIIGSYEGTKAMEKYREFALGKK